MKTVCFIVFALCFSTLAAAERIEDRVYSYSKGKTGEEDLLLLESGRVVFVKQSHAKLLQNLEGEKVELDIGKDNTLKDVNILPEEPGDPAEESEPEPSPLPEDIADATILPDYQSAMNIFSKMNRYYRNKSECSDRAHVWSYESWKKHGLIGRKVFLFFTNTYIRRYRFHWWFHVSPYTLIQNEGSVAERVMDRRYSRSPLQMKTWTDIFIRSKKSCPVSTYRHYRGNRNGAEHCFVVKSAMYYRLPLHVRNKEDYGTIKTRFSTSEVNFSYRAFTRRGVKK